MSSLIVVNADDLGLSRSVNDGIFEALDAKVVSDASLLANGEGFEHAVEGLKSRGRKSIGIHFCLVDKEKPLARIPDITSVSEGDFFFRDRNRLFKKILLGGKKIARVLALELEAQIARISGAGLNITHLDSHQHTHLFPGISKMVLEACLRHKIPFIRVPSTQFKSPVALAVEIFSLLLRRSESERVQFVPSLGFENSGKLSAENFRENFNRALKSRSKLVEIMVHPGRADNATRQKYAHWGYNWDRELEILLGSKGEDSFNCVSYESALEKLVK